MKAIAAVAAVAITVFSGQAEEPTPKDRFARAVAEAKANSQTRAGRVYDRVLSIVIVAMLVIYAIAMPACSSQSWGSSCDEALDQAQAIKSWHHVYDLMKRFTGCDDGAVAEGYSDFVVHTLATRWASTVELKSLIDSDASFLKFVVEHVDGTTDTGELKAVVVNATRHCPKGALSLCRAISTQALEAVAESEAVQRKRSE